jgi:hypothetical protein
MRDDARVTSGSQPTQPDADPVADPLDPGHIATWRRIVLAISRLQPSGNPSGLVYGMIVASVVITAEVNYKPGVAVVLGATALTVGVYWLTHVYCHLLGHVMSGETRRIPWNLLTATLRGEATVLWGGLIELVAVGLAYAVGTRPEHGDWVAIGTSMVLLFLWGLVVGVRNQQQARYVLADATLGASLGALVAILKFLLK